MKLRPDPKNLTQFFPNSDRVDTAVWMHYMDGNSRKNLMATTQECCKQYWTNPRSSTPQSSSWTAYPTPSWKLSKLDEPDMWDNTGDKLISDVLLWTPSHGWAKTGRPARTYIQQLCADMGCSLEDLPESMDVIEGWGEKVWDICAIYLYIYIYLLKLSWSLLDSLLTFYLVWFGFMAYQLL